MMLIQLHDHQVLEVVKHSRGRKGVEKNSPSTVYPGANNVDIQSC